MKRLISLLLALMLCAALPLTSLAEERETDSPFFQTTVWKPEDVDVSGVQEVNGRLMGVVKLPAVDWRELPTAELRVDCPLPTDFIEEQQVTLHVSYQKITTKQLLTAMEDVLGEKPAKDCGSGYAYNDRQTHVVCYIADNGLDSYGWWKESAQARLQNDPAYDVQYEQARDGVRQIIEHFGGNVNEGVFHATRRDAEHMILGSDTYASNAVDVKANERASFDEHEKTAGRTTCEYTMVKGLYELRGLPVMDQYYWRNGSDWIVA